MNGRRALTIALLALCAGAAGCNASTPAAVTATVTVSATTTTVATTTVTQAAPAAEPTGEPDVDGGGLESGPAESSAQESAIPGLESEGADVDPCALVTLADAQKLAATKLDPADKIQQTCTYSGPVSGPTAQVQVFVGPGSKKQLDIERTLGHPLRKLSGVRDEAWAGEAAVFVRKGQLWASVELVRLNEPAENAPRLEQLAAVVAGRL